MGDRAGSGDSILEVMCVIYGAEIASFQATAASEVRWKKVPRLLFLYLRIRKGRGGNEDSSLKVLGVSYDVKMAGHSGAVSCFIHGG